MPTRRASRVWKLMKVAHPLPFGSSSWLYNVPGMKEDCMLIPTQQFRSVHVASVHSTSLQFSSIPFTSLKFISVQFILPNFISVHFPSVKFILVLFTSLHSSSLVVGSQRGEFLVLLWFCVSVLVPKLTFSHYFDQGKLPQPFTLHTSSSPPLSSLSLLLSSLLTRS